MVLWFYQCESLFLEFVKKHDDKTFWISFVVGFPSWMMLKNCRYSGYVAWHIGMDKNVEFTLHLLHNMSFCKLVVIV